MKKIFLNSIIISAFLFAFVNTAFAETKVFLNGPFDGGGFGECYYKQYTSTDANSDGVYEENTLSILHGHWSGSTCVMSVLVAGEDGDELEEGLILSFWNFLQQAISTGKTQLNTKI